METESIKIKTFTLKACRVNIGLSQKEMAQKLGIRREQLIKWEKGKVKLKQYQKEKCAEICQVDIDMINFF